MEDKFEAQIRDLKQLLPDAKKMEDELAKAIENFAENYNDPKFTAPLTALYDEIKPKPGEKTLPDRERFDRVMGMCTALLSKVDRRNIPNKLKELEVQLFVLELKKIQASALNAVNDLSKIAALKAAQAETENPVKAMTPPPSPKPQRIEPKESPAKPVKIETIVQSTDEAAERMRKQKAAEEWAKQKDKEREAAEAEQKKRVAESDKRIEMFGKLHEDLDAISEKLKAFENRSLSKESRERLAALERALQFEVHDLEHQPGEDLLDFKKRLNAFVAECEKKFEEFVEGVKADVSQEILTETRSVEDKDQAVSAAPKNDDNTFNEKMDALLTSMDDLMKSSAGASNTAAQSLQDANNALADSLRPQKYNVVRALETALDEKRSKLSANIKISEGIIKDFEAMRLAAKDANLEIAINTGVKKWWDFLPTRLADTISIRLAGIPAYQERVDLVKQQCVSAQCVADLKDPNKFHSEHLDLNVVREALVKGKFGDVVNRDPIVSNFLYSLGWFEKIKNAIAEVESKKVPMKVDDSEERKESRVKRAFSDLTDKMKGSTNRLRNSFNKPSKS